MRSSTELLALVFAFVALAGSIGSWRPAELAAGVGAGITVWLLRLVVARR